MPTRTESGAAGLIRLWILGFGVALAASVQPLAQATPILYEESVDGDLSWVSPPFLALGFGANQILGSATWGYADDQLDFDSFVFEIPFGGRLQTLRYQQSLLPTGSGDFNFVGYTLGDMTMMPLMTTVFPVPYSDAAFMSVLPLKAGIYTMNPHSFSGVLREGDVRSVTYGWTLEVVPVGVPEASTLAQLALGGAALALLRRRLCNAR